MSIDAYHQARSYAETPRAIEHRLIGDVTRDMVRADDAGLSGIALMPALHRNRQMWSTFALLCEDDANALSPELRSGIISLALWVDRHTSEVVRGTEAIDHLIEVNRSLMGGLTPVPVAVRTAA